MEIGAHVDYDVKHISRQIILSPGPQLLPDLILLMVFDQLKELACFVKGLLVIVPGDEADTYSGF